MAASTTELILKFRGDSGDLKATMAQVRAELGQTARTQTTVNKGELSMRQQLAAAQSLQRQRSAALISQWKQQESAARSLASGVAPVGTNLQRITDTMQTLARSTATIQGPLGGVAGRLSSVGAIAGETSGSLGLVGVAVGAVTVAITALAVGFIKLTTATAEFQGKFADLSQQVGVSVETLSTLNVLASTTGGSIDTVTGSLALFQRNLEEAHDPTSKEAALLKELGVTSLETEAALRQTLKGLFDLGVGARQTDAVLQLFGRSGRFVNAILKESEGNLDAATEKFSRMGLIVSTEAAVAADKFNDTLTILEEQLASVGRMLATQSIPVFIAFFEDISRALTGNANSWETWSNVIETEIAVVLGTLEGFITWIATRFTIDLTTAIDSSIKALLDRAQNIRAVIGVEAVTERAAGLGARPRPRGTGKAARDTALQDATKEAALAEREALVLNAADVAENKRALEEQVRDIEEYTRRAIELADQRQDAAIVRINAEQAALDAALARKLITQTEYEAKSRELTIRNAEVDQRNTEEKFRLEQERDRRISEAQQATRDREEQIAAEADQRITERIKARIQDRVISEADGERQIAAIIDEGFARRKRALEEEANAYATTLERREAINAELIRLDGERAGAAEEAARRIEDARRHELERERQFAAELLSIRRRISEIQADTARAAIVLSVLRGDPRQQIIRAQAALDIKAEQERHERAVASLEAKRQENLESTRTAARQLEIEAELNREREAEEERHNVEMVRLKTELDAALRAAGPEGGFLGGLATGQLAEFEKGIQSFADAAVVAFSAVGAAINGLAQGFGNLIQNWVLLGSQADINMKKLVASVLAGVAAQSAVLAIFELAKGFASLFFNPAEAAAHFKAAALFGSIALVTGLAGRAIAGNSFQTQNQTAGATQGGGASGTTGRTTATERPVVDVNRTPGQPLQPINVFLTIAGEAGEAFKFKVVDTIVQNVRSNGEVRQMLLSER